jgi:hypothetical protein
MLDEPVFIARTAAASDFTDSSKHDQLFVDAEGHGHGIEV